MRKKLRCMCLKDKFIVNVEGTVWIIMNCFCNFFILVYFIETFYSCVFLWKISFFLPTKNRYSCVFLVAICGKIMKVE